MPSIRDKLAAKKSKLALPKKTDQEHPANLNNYADGSFYHIEIDQILDNPHQPRQYFDEEALAELAQSISQKGIIQPIVVRRDESGQVILVAGERRLRAAKMVGLESVPAILTKGNPLEISLIENLQRENLKPLEEAEAFAEMIKEYNYTQDKLALVIGKAKSTVSETLSLNKLPAVIKEEVRRAEQYPRRLLVEIAKQGTEDKMVALFEAAKSGQLKSEQVRTIARQYKEKVQRVPVAIALDRVLALSKYLEKMDFAAIEQGQKAQLLVELEQLKHKIEALLK